MSDDLDRVRRARPAAGGPDPAVTDAARRSLMATIATAPDPSVSDPPAPRRRRRRRRMALVLVPVAVLAAGATAWAGYVGFGVSPDSPDYRDAIAAAERATPLPPGHRWTMAPIPAKDPTDGGAVAVALGSASQRVTMNAMCHWESAWLDAIHAGSAAGVARSEQVYRQLSMSIPIHRDGQPEEAGGVDVTGHRLWIRIADTAARGNTFLLRRDLRLNCPSETRQPTDW